MLNYILGRACTGKSHRIIREAAKASLCGQTIIIVPEQFTFETERSLLEVEEKNFENIQVLSFTKLYSVVASQYGLGRLPLMSDGERILFTDMALKQSEEQLKVFARFIQYPDFCIKIADVIKDFKFAAVEADRLLEVAGEIGGTTGAKLHDIAVIMSVYDAIISERFIDPSDNLTRLDSFLLEERYFENKTVFFDSFTGFTGQQMRIIRKILSQAVNTTFSFCSDNIESTALNQFYNINKTAQKIRTVAEELGVTFAEPCLLSENFYINTTLSNLEKSFISGKSELENTDESDNLRIIRCTDPETEAFAATSIVRNLVENQGYRYRDFIIVARNAEDYLNDIDSFCHRSGIQCFCDKKVSLSDTIISVYISSLIKLCCSFTTENVLNWLKCGFNNYRAEDIYRLEEYIYVWNLSGKDWSRRWEMNPAGIKNDEMSESTLEKLEKINLLRQDIYDKLAVFGRKFKGSAKQKATALYDFLKSENISSYLAAICKKYEERGDRFDASVLRQAWDRVMSALNSIAAISDSEMSADEFLKAFTVFTKAITISNVPQMLDEVTFGSADRIRPSKPKVAIILGANQGKFPNTAVATGLLSVQDKSKLEEHKIDLNDDAVKSSVEENYLVYSMSCCPTHKTFILFSKKTATGNTLEPSSFVTAIDEMLDNVHITDFEYLAEDFFMPPTPETAVHIMSDIYGSCFDSLKDSLAESEQVKNKLATYELDEFKDDFTVSPENAKKIFGTTVEISPTNFDKFYECRLKYFLRFGIGANKLQKAELGHLQRGLVIHYVLEKLIDKYHKAIGTLSREDLTSEIDRLIYEYVSQIPGSDTIMTARFSFMLQRISRAVKDVVFHIADEFAQSGFDPAYCEFRISDDKGDAPALHTAIDEGEIVLGGKIDRVDIYKNVIRVIDYKSGSKEFNLSDTVYGLNMQMLLYLYALVKNKNAFNGKQSSGGILYMPAASDSKHKTLAMNGLILDDAEVRTAMEKNNEGRFIPEHNDKSKYYVDEEMFSLIFDHIDRLLVNMGNSVLTGDFKAEPRNGVSTKACAYCDYAAICKSSQRTPTETEKLSNEAVRSILKGDETSGV